MTSLPEPAAHALAKVRGLHEKFGQRYPASVTVDDVYPLRPAQDGEPEGGNTRRSTGFYPGMLWLAHELTGESRWLDAARSHVPSFVDRIARKVDVDHHELGFLYGLTCVPAAEKLDDAQARAAAVAAADELLTRYIPEAGIIQARSREPGATSARAVVDSLINSSLLYWAAGATTERHYAELAHGHAQQLARHIVRDDGTLYYEFHFDPATGEPLDQPSGLASSCWARGQAWGLYGFTVNFQHTGDETLLAAARHCARYFTEHLPSDHVPFWDLRYSDGDDQPRDSSAGAIASCGLLELAHATGNEEYEETAAAILDALTAGYATAPGDDGETLLRHGVVSMEEDSGVDEGTLWGDYFYLEALTRRELPDWRPYWLPQPTTHE